MMLSHSLVKLSTLKRKRLPQDAAKTNPGYRGSNPDRITSSDYTRWSDRFVRRTKKTSRQGGCTILFHIFYTEENVFRNVKMISHLCVLTNGIITSQSECVFSLYVGLPRGVSHNCKSLH